MHTTSIKVGSYTLARRGCELLKQNRIPCELRKCSDNSGRYGCLYSITVASDQLWRAENLLRSAGIMVLS